MSTRSLLNRLFIVAALALTTLLILTALPLASTAAPRPLPGGVLSGLTGYTRACYNHNGMQAPHHSYCPPLAKEARL